MPFEGGSRTGQWIILQWWEADQRLLLGREQELTGKEQRKICGLIGKLPYLDELPACKIKTN